MLLKGVFVHFIDSSVILEAPGLQFTGGRLLFLINNVFNSVCSTHKLLCGKTRGVFQEAKLKVLYVLQSKFSYLFYFVQKVR